MANVVSVEITGKDLTAQAVRSATGNMQKIGAEMRGLGQTFNQVGNIAHAFGNNQLASVVNGLEFAVTGSRALGAALGGTRLALFGVAGGAVAAAGAVYGYVRAQEAASNAKFMADAKSFGEILNAIKISELQRTNATLASRDQAILAIDKQIEAVRNLQIGSDKANDAIQRLFKIRENLLSDFSAKDAVKSSQERMDAEQKYFEQVQQWMTELNTNAETFNQEMFDHEAERRERRMKDIWDMVDAEKAASVEIIALKKAEFDKASDLVKRARSEWGVYMNERGEMELNALQFTLNFLEKSGEAAKAFGKKGFAVYKQIATAQAIIDTLAGANAAFRSLAQIPYVGVYLGAAAAAAALASGYARVKQIQAQQAHGGLDYVPQDATYVLKQGEMVLDPGTSEAVRNAAMGGGGGTVHVVVNIGERPVIDVVQRCSRDGRLVIDARSVKGLKA